MRDILFDSGPLAAFFFAGNLEPSLIGSHRRLSTYNTAQVERLSNMARDASRHVSLPNILSEASNHLGDSRQSIIPEANEALENFILAIDEIYQCSPRVVTHREYRSMGLTDTAIFSVRARLVEEGVVVVTQDYELSRRLAKEGVSVVNSNHWRTPK